MLEALFTNLKNGSDVSLNDNLNTKNETEDPTKSLFLSLFNLTKNTLKNEQESATLTQGKLLVKQQGDKEIDLGLLFKNLESKSKLKMLLDQASLKSTKPDFKLSDILELAKKNDITIKGLEFVSVDKKGKVATTLIKDTKGLEKLDAKEEKTETSAATAEAKDSKKLHNKIDIHTKPPIAPQDEKNDKGDEEKEGKLETKTAKTAKEDVVQTEEKSVKQESKTKEAVLSEKAEPKHTQTDEKQTVKRSEPEHKKELSLKDILSKQPSKEAHHKTDTEAKATVKDKKIDEPTVLKKEESKESKTAPKEAIKHPATEGQKHTQTIQEKPTSKEQAPAMTDKETLKTDTKKESNTPVTVENKKTATPKKEDTKPATDAQAKHTKDTQPGEINNKQATATIKDEKVIKDKKEADSLREEKKTQKAEKELEQKQYEKETQENKKLAADQARHSIHKEEPKEQSIHKESKQTHKSESIFLNAQDDEKQRDEDNEKHQKEQKESSTNKHNETAHKTDESNAEKTVSHFQNKFDLLNRNDVKNSIQYLSDKLKDTIENYKPPFMRLKLELNPKNLGSVDVTLVTRGNNLHVTIGSNSQALMMLAQNSSDFKNSLLNIGFGDVNMNFNSQSNSGGGSQNREGGNGNQSGNRNSLFRNSNQEDEGKENVELIIPRYI